MRRPGVHRDAGPRSRRGGTLARRPEAAAGPGGAEVAAAGFAKSLEDKFAKPARRGKTSRSKARDYTLGHGAVVIAAITSCTNTSNPSVLIAAGLVARNAAREGLKVKPWVKTSLAPGSQVVTIISKRRACRRTSTRSASTRRLRLHDLHRQFRAAAGADLGGDPEQRPCRRGGVVGQPQFRGPGQSGRQGQLSGLAAAGGRLCARRLDDWST